MLAMQVNHSSLLRSWLLSVVSFSRSSWEPSVSLSPSLSFSISLYPPLSPPSGHPFIQFTLSFVAMEGEKATYVRTLHRIPRSFFVSLFLSRSAPLYDSFSLSLSLSLFFSSLLRYQILHFPTRAMRGHKKAKRDEAEFRAKEREDESKATNKLSRIILFARGQNALGNSLVC